MKKGQSQIITVVLLILLVLAGIVIVWSLVNNTVSESSNEISTEKFEYKANLAYEIISDEEIRVLVERKSGGDEISNIQILLETDEESKTFVITEGLPKPLEKRLYRILSTESGISNLSKIKHVEIYFGYVVDGKDKITLKLDEDNAPTKLELMIICVDDDNDGYDNCDLGLGDKYDKDCNDSDNSTYSMAKEICDNRDNNCDGVIDENGADCVERECNTLMGCSIGTCIYTPIKGAGCNDGQGTCNSTGGCGPNPWCNYVDSNNDGKVDVGDLGALAANYGATNCAESNKWCHFTDINKDGKVDVGDLGALAAHYGETDCSDIK